MFNNLLISTGAVVGIVIAVVVVILLIAVVAWYINTRNAFVVLKNKVEEAWATIDVYLKKRFDLIPNLVETVKGYAKHESETLEKVIAARKMAMTAGTPDEKAQAENMLSGTLKSLFALRLEERYPELKADANFMDLMNQLKSVESEIASARRYYNGTVKELNTLLDYFFTGMVGRRMRLEKRKYFELESEEERKAPQVKF